MNEFWSWFESEARPKLATFPRANRSATFAEMFKYLDNLKRPVCIVETGCMRKLDWGGDGCSTLLFDKYVGINGGQVHSVDIDPKATEFSRNLLNAAMHLIEDDTLVVVDDSIFHINDFGYPEILGKAGLIARHAIEVGADMLFCTYQIGWTGMKKKVMPLETHESDEDIKKLILKARAYFEADKGNNASSIFRLILQLTERPKTKIECLAHGEACIFFARAALANQRFGIQRYGTASDWYRKALIVDPKAAEYRLEFATKVLRPLGYIKEGQREAMLATKLDPKNPFTWRILGGFEHDLGNEGNTIHCYEKELELDPNDPLSILDMISILLDVPDYEKAKKLANKIIETDQKGEGYHCLAFIAQREGRHEEAIELFDKAFEFGVSQPATVHWNKSLSYHAIGKYREGWVEHDWRALEKTQIALSMPMLRFSRPVWNNEPPPAKIHVHAEAGAGDNLCCVRYLKLLVDKGYDVRYETYEDMVGLMSRSFPEVKIVPKSIDYPGVIGIEDFDYHQPIGWLPKVLETDIDTVPWFGPYLKADLELVKKYSEKLPKNRKKVGICWSSGIREGLWLAKY